jgi:hypothetical protein
LLRKLAIDVRHLNAAEPDERPLGEGVYQNFWGERYVYGSPPWGPMREDLPGALARTESLHELESFAWPSSLLKKVIFPAFRCSATTQRLGKTSGVTATLKCRWK